MKYKFQYVWYSNRKNKLVFVTASKPISKTIQELHLILSHKSAHEAFICDYKYIGKL